MLERVYENHEQAGNTIRLKRARRPDGVMTSKAEIDDIARHGGDRAGREKLRRKVEEDDER